MIFLVNPPQDYYTAHYNPQNNITSILPRICPLAGMPVPVAGDNNNKITKIRYEYPYSNNGGRRW